jgi:hypothetical protein
LRTLTSIPEDKLLLNLMRRGGKESQPSLEGGAGVGCGLDAHEQLREAGIACLERPGNGGAALRFEHDFALGRRLSLAVLDLEAAPDVYALND